MTTTAQRVLTRYQHASTETARRVVARYVASFAKFHPVFDVVRRARKDFDKAFAAIERFAKIVSRAKGYKGDPERARDNAVKYWQAVDAALGVVTKILGPVDGFIQDYGKDLSSDYRRSTLERLLKWKGQLQAAMKEIETSHDYHDRGTSLLWERTLRELHVQTINLISETEMAAKLPRTSPGAVDPNASPEDRLKAHITRDILSMAKASAKKLGGKVAPCAALGLDVLEDVNAHAAASKIEGMLAHYIKEVTEDEYKVLRPLVNKVSTAIDWNILDAGAFLVAILQVVRAPEAGHVMSTLANVFDDDK